MTSSDDRIRVLTHRNGELSVYRVGGVSGQPYCLCTACGGELSDLISSFVQFPNQLIVTISDRILLSKLHIVFQALNKFYSDYTHLDLVWVGATVVARLRHGDRLDAYTINLQTGVLSPVAKPKGEDPCAVKS
jgi:hypothetical protein